MNGYGVKGAVRITPAQSMKRYVGSPGFLIFSAAALLFLILHQRVITTELQYGVGGIWCSLGGPAALCLVISTALTYFSSKTRLLPALVPIIGLGGIGASLIIYFVITITMLGRNSNTLGVLQEVMLLVFLACAFVAVLLLMLSGVGLKVAPQTGWVLTAACVLALILYSVRAMYSFSSLITALNRNLLLSGDAMENEISWILRSVQAGTDAAQTMYYDRMLDAIGTALLLLSCLPCFLRFSSFFGEENTIMTHASEIPREHHSYADLTAYDEYTEETVGQGKGGGLELDANGYYIERKHAKFVKRERSERVEDEPELPEEGSEPPFENKATMPIETPQEDDPGEYFDNYAPGEGIKRFRVISLSAAENDENEGATERRRVKVKPSEALPPTPDPKDPAIWSNYRK